MKPQGNIYLPDPEDQIMMPALVIASTCCSVVVRAGLYASSQARSCSYPGQSFRPLSMTMLMTLSWRFLLILAPERTRCVSWVVARNPAGWTFELWNTLLWAKSDMAGCLWEANVIWARYYKQGNWTLPYRRLSTCRVHRKVRILLWCGVMVLAGAGCWWRWAQCCGLLCWSCSSGRSFAG